MNYCNECGKETNYVILQEHKESYSDDYQCMYKYLIVQCSGCNDISFRYEFHDIEAAYPTHDPYRGEEWHVPITISTYPKVKKHKMIEGSEFIPEVIYKAYKQTVDAYEAEASILAGIGFRAIIEAICSDQSVKEGNLQESIDKLLEKGILSKHDADLLHSIRFLGNDAAHEIKEPANGQLVTTLKIIEHLLESLYILPRIAERELETVINTYEQFENILSKAVAERKSGEELPLRVILGKVARRFTNTYKWPEAEAELNTKIIDGTYTKLQIGKVDNYEGIKGVVQHYVIV